MQVPVPNGGDQLVTMTHAADNAAMVAAAVGNEVVAVGEIGRDWPRLAEIGIGRDWPKWAEVGRGCPRLPEAARGCPEVVPRLSRPSPLLLHAKAAVGEAFNCATPSLVTCDSLVRLFTAFTASLHRPSRE